VDHGDDNRPRPGMACGECNDLLIAPRSSAYVSSYEIRHVWFCENCGHEIEMAINLRFDSTSGQSTRLNPIVVAQSEGTAR
jgi:RNase P subunit RPR2